MNSLAEQVLQGAVLGDGALGPVTAHDHICLWNNTLGKKIEGV